MELAIPWSIMEQMALKDIVKNMRTAIRNKQNMLDTVHLFPAVLGRISENELAQSKTTGCIHEQVTMWCVKPIYLNCSTRYSIICFYILP